ncbi:regulator of nonsense transcripts 2-like isoform X2 [Clytia hemisphaerica]|uniref:MIF4G domain-containing protein n=3 Tax=Clytia hemisphaerica TaxID=252671 RepID=A0A7M5UY57_9CNID
MSSKEKGGHGKGNYEKSHRYSSERKNKPGNQDKRKQSSSEEEKAQKKNQKKEEPVPKQSEEQLAKEQEELKRQAEEEEKERERQKLEDEKKAATEAKSSAEERVKNRLKLRQENADIANNRPNEGFFKKLDSSMKKNTTFVKKLRTMTEQQRDSLINEFNGLNLSKFIQEAVTNLVDAKMKVSDVSAVAAMCSLFHQRYAEFTPLFKKNFSKNFDGIDCKDEDKSGNVSKLRTSLRLLGELVLDGVYGLDNGISLLKNFLQTIVSSDKTSFAYAAVILTIVRHCGEDIAGILPRKHRHWKEELRIELPLLNVINPDQQSIFLCLFKEYYEALSKHIVVSHKTLQNRERQNKQTIGLKGELPADRKEAFEKAQKTHEKLLTSLNSLSELLDEEMPDLPEDEQNESEDMGTVNVFTPLKGVEYDSETGLWEDEDTRTFYEKLEDLKEKVPQILFKESTTSTSSALQKKRSEKKKHVDRKLRHDINMADDDVMDFYDDVDDNFEQEVLGDDNEEEDPTVGGMAALAETYFQKLPTCVNRDFIDQASEEFLLKLNTKGNRKKLVRNLFTVNRTRLDLLPFYSRLVATLTPCLPEIAPDLVYLLKGSFLSHLRKKDQIHTEAKIKTVRFIGELTKFKVCPKAETLHCLKLLLDNFTHHNIDMACNLLETCGRFLYRSPESHPRMSALLEQMLRKKSAHAFDARHVTMIENAFYYCNPPERQKIQRKIRPPMHEYIRKLLYKDLSKTTTEKVLRQMRKLPWKEEKIKPYAVKCMINVWNIKFNNIRCLANMLAGISDYHDDVAISVVDGVLENIRLGMETNVFRDNQRRLSSIKFLGEMYNYRLIDSQLIFSTLYLMLTFGACVDMSLSELDPPEHLFRIRLICTLLDTCGQYFDRGSTKKKMDCFLIFFQLYIRQKKESECWNENCPFPRDVDFMIADTIESMRPKLKLYSSVEEAQEAANELTKEYEEKIKLISSAPDPNNISGSVDSTDDSNLSPSPFNSSPLAFSPFGRSQSSQDDDEEIAVEDYVMGDGGEEGYGDEFDEDGDQMFMMDEEVTLREAPKHLQCEEDDLFCKEFDRLMGESLTERLTESSTIPHLDIAIPMNLKGKQKKYSTSTSTSVEEEKQSNCVNFVLMMKRNNKQIVKDLNIPMTSDLAANIHHKQLAKQAEHEEMKRLVLDYNQRQEEESYNEMMQQTRVQRKGGYSYNRQHRRGGHHQQQQPVQHTNRLKAKDVEQALFNTTGSRR